MQYEASHRWVARLRLTIITGFTVLVLDRLIALRRASWMAGPSRWDRAEPLDVITWIAWAGSLLAAGWLLTSVALALAARASGNRSLTAASNRFAAAAVRRLAERATAVSVVASTLVAPATALAQDDVPPIPVIVVAPEASRPLPPLEPATSASLVQAPTDRSTRPAVPAILVDAPPEIMLSVQPATETADHHTVRPGDNLWTISCSALAERLGRMPTDAETAAYWRRVIDANTAGLRSGNPDLIHPGEVITLPEAG